MVSTVFANIFSTVRHDVTCAAFIALTMRRTSPQPSPLLLLLAFISTASSFHLFLGGNAPQLVGRTGPSSVLLDTPPHLFCGCSRIVDSRDLHAVFPDEGAGDFTLFCTHRGITSDFGYLKPDRLNKPDPFGTRARFKTKSRYSPPSVSNNNN